MIWIQSPPLTAILIFNAERTLVTKFAILFPIPEVHRGQTRKIRKVLQRLACIAASSETQGQLVGTTGFSWAKVYNKCGRAPGHSLLPIQFQKRLNSLLLIGQLANQRRGIAGRLSCLLTRGCFPHRWP